MNVQTSETEVTHNFVQPLDGEDLASLLHRCIPKVQTKRAQAYNRLNTALLESNKPRNAADQPHTQSRPKDPFEVFDPSSSQPKDYPVVCAHVTEDLKLCSEAIIKLRALLAECKELAKPISGTPESEVRNAIKWLDTLQDLEEKKLVCTVSVHAISRSNAATKRRKPVSASTPSTLFSSDNPEVKQQLAAYAKQLNGIDTDINSLLQEVMEYWLEHVENG
ncbi:hypothetical protein BWQ96_02669 [Gracilariopsis chorda]|uniref:Uncharacterized protein n=1 Tax=Gracilariopsis chorda TaxID=448386 RepID=A0A2V3IZM5_9FLOR|nr:hypothetical protein BWQ96_02669 [Gracilariopsis chorda]|eukprot:PXF47525.1 hypothetical protein BWQ96_02669 [Gracilariopsis chorda]